MLEKDRGGNDLLEKCSKVPLSLHFCILTNIFSSVSVRALFLKDKSWLSFLKTQNIISVLFLIHRTPNFKMSGATESPVSKYGRSSEFGAVLDFIQTMISNDTLRQAFNIPHLVMVGRQNMAKTTLINRLIGRYLLPMRRNETANTLQARTTYPIILNLRNGPKTKVEVRCESIPDIAKEEEDPSDDLVEKFLQEVSDRLPKEEGTPISKTPVNVTLQSKPW